MKIIVAPAPLLAERICQHLRDEVWFFGKEPRWICSLDPADGVGFGISSLASGTSGYHVFYIHDNTGASYKIRATDDSEMQRVRVLQTHLHAHELVVGKYNILHVTAETLARFPRIPLHT